MKTSLISGLLSLLMPALVLAGEYDLTVDRVKIDTGDFVKQGIGYNGKSPDRSCVSRKVGMSRST